MRNRRDDERNRAKIHVTARLPDGSELAADLVDHSATGIGLTIARPVTLGANLQVLIGAQQLSRSHNILHAPRWPAWVRRRGPAELKHSPGLRFLPVRISRLGSDAEEQTSAGRLSEKREIHRAVEWVRAGNTPGKAVLGIPCSL